MVIGTAGELPKAPEKATVFLEGALVFLWRTLDVRKLNMPIDMDDSELAEAVSCLYLETRQALTRSHSLLNPSG